MNTLKIDDKWSVEYDPADNDRPVEAIADGKRVPMAIYNLNAPLNIAMFYALLEARTESPSADPEAPVERRYFFELINMATEIHGDNVRAGWWTDLETGELTLRTRNRPEMLMLAVSEIAEAAHGVDGEMDDKLPHLPMYDVELADFVIRQIDQIGAEIYCENIEPEFTGNHEHTLRIMRPISRSDRLMYLVTSVSGALEHYRKGRMMEYVQAMADGVYMAFCIAEVEGINLMDIIAQKRAFNRTRPDHQMENRKMVGGKRI